MSLHPPLLRWQLLPACHQNLYSRLTQHQAGEGANHTRETITVILVYVEVYSQNRSMLSTEKQIQTWRKKKPYL